MTDLAYIDAEQGDHAAAQDAYLEAMGIFAGLGHRRGMARALEGYACLALRQGNGPNVTLKLAAAAAHLRKLIGASLHSAEQSKLDQALLPAWESLSEEEGKRAWNEGTAMNMERMIQYSLE